MRRLAAVFGVAGARDALLGERPLVPLLLTLLLGGLITVMLTEAHLAGAAGLAPWLTPSPLPPLSPVQTGKLLVYAGLAALVSGSLLLVRKAVRLPADRRLTAGFAWLLLPGGGLFVGLDLAFALGFQSSWIDRAEHVVEWAVLGGCVLLLGHRLLRRGGTNSRPRG